MNTVAAPKTGFKFMLVVREGPDKGVSYQLLPPKVTIGREKSNNIALTDPRVSRQAAVMEFTMEKILLKDISSRNSLMVNGHQLQEASIKDGDVLRIGDSELVFIVEAIPLQASGVPARPPIHQHAPQAPPSGTVVPFPSAPPGSGQLPAFGQMPPPSMGYERQASPFPRSAPSMPVGDGGKKLRFYIILGVGLALVGWLLTSKPAEKAKEPGLRTVEEIEQDLKASEERQDAIVKKRTFKSDEEKTRYEEANKHYLEGFRDYQKGQFVRAMKSFETARAIDPEHEMAKRYYKLAEKQRDEMIAFMILEGKRYKEKNMFTRCSAAFEKALDAIPDKDDLKYKQAEALKKECDLLIDDRFQ